MAHYAESLRKAAYLQPLSTAISNEINRRRKEESLQNIYKLYDQVSRNWNEMYGNPPPQEDRTTVSTDTQTPDSQPKVNVPGSPTEVGRYDLLDKPTPVGRYDLLNKPTPVGRYDLLDKPTPVGRYDLLGKVPKITGDEIQPKGIDRGQPQTFGNIPGVNTPTKSDNLIQADPNNPQTKIQPRPGDKQEPAQQNNIPQQTTQQSQTANTQGQNYTQSPIRELVGDSMKRQFGQSLSRIYMQMLTDPNMDSETAKNVLGAFQTLAEGYKPDKLELQGFDWNQNVYNLKDGSLWQKGIYNNKSGGTEFYERNQDGSLKFYTMANGHKANRVLTYDNNGGLVKEEFKVLTGDGTHVTVNNNSYTPPNYSADLGKLVEGKRTIQSYKDAFYSQPKDKSGMRKFVLDSKEIQYTDKEFREFLNREKSKYQGIAKTLEGEQQLSGDKGAISTIRQKIKKYKSENKLTEDSAVSQDVVDGIVDQYLKANPSLADPSKNYKEIIRDIIMFEQL